MKNDLWKISLLAVILFITLALNGQSVPPRIISTIPEFGDCQVSPDLKEIVVKFDQDMQNGMSIVNSPFDPEITDQVKWTDQRTLVIPVKLYPDKMYSLAFNNARFTNFRNINNIPLNPDKLLFKTVKIKETNLNKDSYKELTEIFPSKYSYASLKTANWQDLLKQMKPEFDKADSKQAFAIKLVKLMRNADDPHLWVDIEGENIRLTTNTTAFPPANNGNMKPLSILQNIIKSKGFGHIAGNIDSIGYLAIRSWDQDFFNMEFTYFNNSQLKTTADSVLIQLFKFPNLIIDVRDNGGGNEEFARKIAAYFVTDSVPYEKVKYLDEKSGKFDKEHIKKIYPNNEPKYTGNVYLITGPAEMSSNESFVLMMKQYAKTKTIGMKTFGSSGNPQPYKLSNGVTLFLPSWQAYMLDGTLIEGNGIKPDITLNTTPEDFKETDPIIDEIIRLTKAEK